ncbi:ABC transporter permease subunit [Rhodococcus sp. BP-252]|uniref:Nitrate ABC transporter permease n=1 Tax=Rhodococcoides kyotonense TaxID=398843 RepID=A0A177YJF8_9NOCA|nr:MULTISPECIES: ABC transporter permease subunit [Rhodococcus]MBY6410659.1 ABC transporter permease subunit [Rhodococcus sp. BP-320]MBY6415516.1 ABC transporter permease subunit [Rhodococcus sp. BP-321]MBY6420131.1 ABC transporter permease subunit [Rhodococcus sp. BP-324]MBY6425215.1 ABC transporter permease subunit [Rhodococcus sp. BP-323]MBY6430722.1 ABC transporter permease subunit [Rhodococcus sp. BP-322]
MSTTTASTIPGWRRHARSQGSSVVATTVAVLSILAVWQVAVVVGNRVPSPAQSVDRLVSEAAIGELWHNLAISMNRFLLGLVLALVVGTAIGVLMGMSKLADLALSDLNAAALAIPAVIWALLTTMWFGFGWLTSVVTVFLSGLPFVVVNIAKATRAVPADLILMSRAFGVPRAGVLRHIVAPAVAGSTVAAVRFAIMSAWNGLLLAEWFGATSGVGWRSRYWYDANQLDGFFAWVLVFILLLVIADLLVLGPIERYVSRWRTA